MKFLKFWILLLVSSTLLNSCTTRPKPIGYVVNLEDIVTNYDLWYIDYNRTQGNTDIPFMSRAFTLSFINGKMYANNNIVDIGKTGNGLGASVGTYNTFNDFLELNHSIDGYFDFDVVELSNNEIRIDFKDVSYYLVGYNRSDFDYDKLFYDNIEYFLQEYIAWGRVAVEEGRENIFDEERFLQFNPENNTTFLSSTDPFGTNIGNIYWGLKGKYTVFNIEGEPELKALVLNYSNGDQERFELQVKDDRTIKLYHYRSNTFYSFIGKGFLQFFKGTSSRNHKTIGRNSGRKRKKIQRKTVSKKYLQ